jgi:hypothetical protein
MKRMSVIALLSLFLFLAGRVHGEQVPASFENLSVLQVDDTPVGPIRILYEPKLTQVILKKDEEVYKEAGVLEIKAIKTKLAANEKEYYIVEYSQGPSVDPSFSIYQEGQDSDKAIFGIAATTLIIPGNGSIYAAGHTNNMFNKRRKFVFKKGKIVEVSQPFLYVGLDTKVNKDVTIYSTPGPTPDGYDVVAHIPKGSKVSVLLNKNDYYLLATPFGLVGWTKIGYEPIGYPTTIEGLYDAGD